MPRQLIQRGSTDALSSYPKLRAVDGATLSQPTAATAKVYTPAVTSPSVQTATRDTLSATTSVAAAEGTTTLTVAVGAAWIRGRRYLLDLTTGEQLVVRAAKGGSSTSLLLVSPLPCDVPVGSTVQGFAISIAMTAVETGREGTACKVEWTATVGGQALEWTESFEIVRRIPRWELDAEELVKRRPEVLGQRDRGDVALDELIETALEDVLLPRLRSRKIREADIISTWALVAPHCAAVDLVLAREGTDTEARRTELRAELEQALDLAMADVDAWYDAPQSEPVDTAQEPEDFSVYGYSR